MIDWQQHAIRQTLVTSDAESLDPQLRTSIMADALAEASLALTSTLNPNEVVDRILAQVIKVAPHDAVNVMLINDSIAKVYQGRGYERFGTAHRLEEIAFPWQQTPGLLQMWQEKRPLIITHVAQYEQWIVSIPEHVWIQSYIGVPLILHGEVIGFLNVMSVIPGFFQAADAERLLAFANHAVIAIHNARLYSQLQQELTRRQQVEAELYTYQTHLQNLVAERTQALQTQNQELQTVTQQLILQNAELDAFAHTVAHDLKNPLSHVIGYAELLLEDLKTLSPMEIQRSAQTILNSSNKLNDIIESLLLLAGVHKQQVEPEPLDMASIVQEACERLYPFIQQKGAQITLPNAPWPTALGYAPWIEEVWGNYLSNALKYGGSPPQLEIGFTLAAPGGATPQLDVAKIMFWIQDHGPGLTLQEQTKLFVPFTRLQRLNKDGYGLGLSIVQRIVHKLGGETGVISELGQGSRFYFTLPVSV